MGARHTMPMMKFSLRRIATAVLTFAIASTTGLVPANSQVTEEDVEQARTLSESAAVDRAAAIENLDQAVAAYEVVRGELEALTFAVGRLRGRIGDYEDETQGLRQELQARAVRSYMNGDERDPVARVFAPETVQQTIIAREVLAQAVESEAARLDSLAASTAEMSRLKEELDLDSARLADLQAESDALVDRMNELYETADFVFDEADHQYQEVKAARDEQERREEEARRQRELMQAALQLPAEGVPDYVTPGFVCPVGIQSWFLNTWGAPRSGGRTHKGVDMMGPYRSPLVAVGDGIVRLSYGSLGGNIVWLYADHGVNYFYAHMDGYASGLVDGQRVSRGQLIGYTGDSGNPAPGAYHVHFGIYPGGITAVNPYPTVQRACS